MVRRRAGRSDNSCPLYSEADLHRLRFIRLCRAMDMSLDEVAPLLALDGACLGRRPCGLCHADEHLSTCARAWTSWVREELSCCAAAATACETQVIDALHARDRLAAAVTRPRTPS